jgi:tetratricopeptide (TPR) repeat protein
VLCLGESTTAQQYPRYLEERLSARAPHLRFSVIDGGLPGTDTSLILAGLDGDLDEYRPDVVVTMLGINDEGWSVPARDGSSWERVRKGLRDLRVVKLARLARAKRVHAGAVETLLENGAVHPRVEEAYRKRALSDLNWRTAAGETASAASPGWKDFRRGESYFEKWAGTWASPENSDLKMAETHFRRALTAGFRSPEIYLFLAAVHEARAEYGKQEAVLREALDECVGHGLMYQWLGHLQEKRGDWDGAEETFRRALELVPRDKNEALAIAVCAQRVARGPRKTAERLFLTAGEYPDVTARNYRAIRDKVLARGARLVCAQYPIRPLAPLRALIGDGPLVRFVDNEATFRNAVHEKGYAAVFRDDFAGDFGHCTEWGNRLLADGIAEGILAALGVAFPADAVSSAK